MSQRIILGIENEQTSALGFVEAWKRAEAGEVTKEERLNFEDLELLLGLLTPKRWELLKTLRGEGSQSIRRLAMTLGRDYKNVHSDVAALEKAGLVRKQDGLTEVPWDVHRGNSPPRSLNYQDDLGRPVDSYFRLAAPQKSG